MTEISDSTSPDFWTSRYEAGRIPWDLGRVPECLRRFLRRNPVPGRVLIPGCGSGYEVRAFHDAGFEVTAIDFSAAAVRRAGSVLGPLASRVRLGDFFTHDFEPGSFDFIYERTFLCALPPGRWPDYRKRIKELLLQNGSLIGVFFYGSEPEPPPYPLTEGRAREIFDHDFRLIHSEAVSGSLPLYQGMERWQEWKKR